MALARVQDQVSFRASDLALVTMVLVAMVLVTMALATICYWLAARPLATTSR
ncbi:hypothetical protein P4S55_06585 [Shewanella sp. PP-Sp27a-2]